MVADRVPAELTTLAKLPLYVQRFGSRPALGRCRAGGVDELLADELERRVRSLWAGLAELGVESGDRVAILSESRPEWVLADLAILSGGAVTVPIYPTLSESQIGFLLRDSGAKIVISASESLASKVRGTAHEVSSLEVVITIEPDGAPPPEGLASITFEALESRGQARLERETGSADAYNDAVSRVERDQLATIIYTSGTTGDPKGVMLTHHNLLSNVHATRDILGLTPDDVALSFLPLSHSFERMVLYLYLVNGVTVIFAESTDTLGRDLLRVRPTVMTGVPRVYEKIQARVLDSVASAPPWRRRLFHWALTVGRACSDARLAGRRASPMVRAQEWVADRLVLAKVRARTGGRLRYLVSGSAPLSRVTGEFFFAVGLPIVEGYGLTETSPVLTVNPADAPRLGTVGRAIRDVALRIAPDGEILASGPNVMVGYFGKPDATRDVLRDGWFHTGDVGYLDPDGYLVITDRKKDLIVTSSGKNIAPQPIEGLLRREPLVAEALVIGDGRRFASALIVPDFVALEARLVECGQQLASREVLVEQPDVLRLYQDIVDRVNDDLAQFERIKRFALVPAELTVADGDLTPTMKVRRKVVEGRWQPLVERLYA